MDAFWTRHELGVLEAERDARRARRARFAPLAAPSFPRLVAARRERCWEMADEMRAYLRVLHHLMEVEALVAHRDLQLHRAIATGRGSYIAVRERKLKAAQRALKRVRAEADVIGIP